MLVTDTGTVTLSKEFKEVTPPRTERQLENRKDFLLKCGRISPFYTWQGILADDYDDYTICKKCNIPFKVVEMGATSKDEVVSEIVYMQLNIGGLSPIQRCEILLRNQKALKATAGWRGYDFPADFPKIAGVSKEEFSDAESVIDFGYKVLLDAVRNEEMSISAAYDLMIERAEMEDLKHDLQMLINTIDGIYGVPKIVLPELQKLAERWKNGCCE